MRPLPWLSPVPLSAGMLGLSPSVHACFFDLDGVLTDSAALHAWAWGEAFDELLLRLSERVGWQFIPFDRDADYREYLDGRPRLEGIHAFLGSRGIRVPEGRADDQGGANTAYGLAARKGEALARGMEQRGVRSRRCPALSRGRRSRRPRARCGLGQHHDLADARARRAGAPRRGARRRRRHARGSLRSQPPRDLLLVACRRLGVDPEQTVTFTHSAAGVAGGTRPELAVSGSVTKSEADCCAALRGSSSRRSARCSIVRSQCPRRSGSAFLARGV